MTDDEKAWDAAIDVAVAREGEILAATDSAEASYARASSSFDQRIAELDAKYAAIPDASHEEYMAEYRAIEAEVRDALNREMEKMLSDEAPAPEGDDSFA